MYGKFGNRANFRLPVFGGFTRFGVWKIQKTQNSDQVKSSHKTYLTNNIYIYIYKIFERAIDIPLELPDFCAFSCSDCRNF